ncbi:hypothetical protein HBH95_174870 [Parastagonospora nodorum]|nr:hypothetical protein HBH95_174870 [Parastagonospora nodorum]
MKITTTILHLNNIIFFDLIAFYNLLTATVLRIRARELGVRHSLLNLSVHDLVEEFARHRNYSLRLLCLIRLRH